MLVDISQIEFFLLIFIRITAALAVMPVFQHAAFPSAAKAGLAAAMSLLLIPILPVWLPPPSGTIVDFLVLAVGETFCGILIGLAGQAVFWTVEIAGQLIGFQAGFTIVSSMDPNTNSQSTVLTKAYNIIAILIFLIIGGHHIMLQSLFDSFETVPIGGLKLDGRLSEWILMIARGVVVNGVKLAAPIMVALLLTDVGLGIMSRVAPAMNIFVLGFPLKIGLTMLFASVTLGMVVFIFNGQVAEYAGSLPAFLRILISP